MTTPTGLVAFCAGSSPWAIAAVTFQLALSEAAADDSGNVGYLALPEPLVTASDSDSPPAEEDGDPSALASLSNHLGLTDCAMADPDGPPAADGSAATRIPALVSSGDGTGDHPWRAPRWT